MRAKFNGLFAAAAITLFSLLALAACTGISDSDGAAGGTAVQTTGGG